MFHSCRAARLSFKRKSHWFHWFGLHRSQRISSCLICFHLRTRQRGTCSLLCFWTLTLQFNVLQILICWLPTLVANKEQQLEAAQSSHSHTRLPRLLLERFQVRDTPGPGPSLDRPFPLFMAAVASGSSFVQMQQSKQTTQNQAAV